MYLRNKIANSIRLALVLGAGATVSVGAAYAQDSKQDESADSEKKIERLQVTGSRIQRTDMEGALPVTVIDREAIELSGEMSAAELIRNTTFNTAGSVRPRSGSSAQGVSSVDMRGLGAGRTLVLVDGRRLTMSPSTGSSQDLNSIPMGAVERIEILSDGASAVYGSDAIGGVINVITRRDFNGVELSLGKGSVSVPEDGGDRENGSLVFGSSSNTTSVLGGVSWNKREIIFERDFPWVVPGASISGNNWRPVKGVDDDGDFTFGGYNPVPNGCRDENFFEDGNRCRYNFNATNAKEASTSNESLFAKVRHDFSDNWTLFANGSFAKTESFGRYAPAPDRNGSASLITPAGSYNNPTNPGAWMYDPRNPNAVPYEWTGDQAAVEFRHRFAAMGNRDRTVNNENVDFLVGLEGRVGDFDVDFGARRVRNKSIELGYGYLAAKNAWDNVNNFNPGYCADGSFNANTCRFGYDIQSPSANPADVIAAGQVTTSRISEFNIDEVFASVGFDMFEIDGGVVQGFVGAESRDEYFNNQLDSQSEAGLVGGSAGSSSGGSRSVDAAYFEMLVPVTYDLELSLAGRFDDYSDYGSDFSPKVSVRYQPVQNLLVRASYGKGFRAPSLNILTKEKAYSADTVRDAATCEVLVGDADKTCQIDAYSIANPELESETSTQMALGLAYQPSDWLNLTADYYNIEIDNRIRSFSSDTLIRREQTGDPIPAGLGVTRNADGTIKEIIRGYANEGTLKSSGVDFNVRTRFDLGAMGRVTNNIQLSHVLEHKVDSGRSTVKDPGRPEQRLNINNVWSKGDYSFAWNINFIGTQYTSVYGRGEDGSFSSKMICDEPAAGVDLVRCGNMGSYTTHDVQFNYTTPWAGRVTLGVQNVFEKLPKLAPLAGSEYADGSRDYNFSLYDTYGRVMYARYTQRF